MSQPVPAGEILLITRIRTLNKGNQALSVAWLEMLNRAFPGASIRLIERRPRHLLQYTLRQVAAARDPFAAFEAIAERLALLAPGPAMIGPADKAEIVLDESLPREMRFLAFRQRLNLRGRLAASGWFTDEYRRRLSAFQRARLVVANPAGEFFPRKPEAAFYHLLDARVAQKLGRPTAIVNHTMDIDDEALRIIIPKMYRTLALVGFRDRASTVAFEKMGGDTSNVLVTPDLALTTDFHATRRPQSDDTRKSRTVAIAINTPEAQARGYLPQWLDVIDRMRANGFAVELVSNEVPADLPFYEKLKRRVPQLKISGLGMSHHDYATLLASYDLIITSRMHTGVLGMVAGTPVVPVEGSSFKITGLFQELGFPTPVIHPAADGWTHRVVEQALRVSSSRETESIDCFQKVSAARERIIAMLVPRLQAAATGDAVSVPRGPS